MVRDDPSAALDLLCPAPHVRWPLEVECRIRLVAREGEPEPGVARSGISLEGIPAEHGPRASVVRCLLRRAPADKVALDGIRVHAEADRCQDRENDPRE